MTRMTQKQRAVWRGSILESRRWNVSYGATRSGKTYLDYFRIPRRISRCTGAGLIMLIGNTQLTLERNILAPMRNIYSAGLVGNINSKNMVTLFGREAYAVGADKISQVARLQGAGIEYAYGDELTTWHPDVFEMLKSRLDKPNSCMDGTCNPANPTHWVKAFLESDADIFQMGFCIDDNPFLDPVFVENLKREYYGTVYYDRFILGLWKAAEGVVYRQFADAPERFIIDEAPPIAFASVGVDFGGNKSAHSFVCTGFTPGMREVVKLKEYYRKKILTPDELANDFIEFIRECRAQWKIIECRADSAEQVLIAGLQQALVRARIPLDVSNALKRPITDRIRLDQALMGTGRFKIMRSCKYLIQAYQDALWNSKAQNDARLDDGSTMIDPLDASEYSVEPFHQDLIARG